jgi:hypothetical protein
LERSEFERRTETQDSVEDSHNEWIVYWWRELEVYHVPQDKQPKTEGKDRKQAGFLVPSIDWERNVEILLVHWRQWLTPVPQLLMINRSYYWITLYYLYPISYLIIYYGLKFWNIADDFIDYLREQIEVELIERAQWELYQRDYLIERRNPDLNLSQPKFIEQSPLIKENNTITWNPTDSPQLLTGSITDRNRQVESPSC